MRGRLLTLCIAFVLMSFAGLARAQTGFQHPSCVASIATLGGSQLARFIPPEIKGQPARALRGVVARSVTWKPGQVIKVCFKSGTDKARERVARHARQWMEHANVVFDFGDGSSLRQCQGDPSEDIRIDFMDGKGWWSFFGVMSRSRDPSMNLQYFGVDTPRYPNGEPAPEAELRKTVLHEFGHALGMLHEHQSPNAGCDAEIDWDVAYALGDKIGWDKAQVDRNFRQLVNSDEFNLTEVDRRSIMHYSLPQQIFKAGIKSPCYVADNLELSEQDRKFIRSVYPKPGDPMVVASGPAATATRGAAPRAGGEDKQALVQEYEQLLRQAGVASERVAELSAELRKLALAR